MRDTDCTHAASEPLGCSEMQGLLAPNVFAPLPPLAFASTSGSIAAALLLASASTAAAFRGFVGSASIRAAALALVLQGHRLVLDARLGAAQAGARCSARAQLVALAGVTLADARRRRHHRLSYRTRAAFMKRLQSVRTLSCQQLPPTHPLGFKPVTARHRPAA